MVEKSRQPPAGADAADLALGARLREVRKQRGIARRTVAQALGVSPQQIEKYEVGLTRISIGRLLRFAEVLETPPAALLLGLRPGHATGGIDDPAYADATVAFAEVARIAKPEHREAALGVLRVIAEGGGHG